jgi:predicted HAD superfamily phosphohydrolase YqeG
MSFLKRIIFSLRQLHNYHQALAIIEHNTPHHQQLHQLSPATLKQHGVKVLVLDFDGVLAAHGELQPTKELHPWLHSAIKQFGSEHIFILSNKPLPSRIAYFKRHFSGIRYISAVKKKPYPDGLEKIITLTGQAPETLMLVDDRLLTGGLAACIAKVPMIYINDPYIRISKRPIQELFFMSLRFIERFIIRLYA